MPKDPTTLKKTKEEAVREAMCTGTPADPVAICAPHLLPLLRWRNVAMLFATLFLGFFMLIRRCCCGRRQAKQKTA
jgi:hypothetical protein